jgi:hypothetical protein
MTTREFIPSSYAAQPTCCTLALYIYMYLASGYPTNFDPTTVFLVTRQPAKPLSGY